MTFHINSISLRNFLSFGNKHQLIEFYPGISLITGFNDEKDSQNGIGKSALLESIPFALFGKTIRNVNKKELVNWKNNKNCEVYLDFKLNGNDYHIERGIKPDFFKIYKDGNVLPQDSNIRDFQNEIEENIYGFDFNVFNSISYANLNSNNSILSMPKNKKRDFLENIFKLNIYTNLHKNCNIKVSSAELNQKEIESKIKFNQTKISDFKSNIIELNEEKKVINKTKKSKQEKESKLIKINNKINLLKDDIKYKNAEELEYKIKHKIDLTLYKVNEFLNNLPEQPNVEYKDEKELIKLQLKYNGQIERIKNKINELNDEIKLFKYLNNDADKRLKKLEDNNKCPLCWSEIDIEKIKEGMEGDKTYRRNLMRNKFKPQLEKLDSLLKDRKYRIEQIKEDRKNNVKIKEWEKIEDKIKKFRKIKSIIEWKLMDLESKVHNDKLKIEEINQLKNERELVNRDIIYLKEKINEGSKIDNKINEYQNKINEIIEENNELEKKISRLLHIIDYYKFLQWICKDENVKSYAISYLIPFLNERTNKYISTTGHSFFVKLYDWLDCEIKGPGIFNCSYGNLSGGESKCLDLSLQFSFHDMAKVQNGTLIDILEIDELLDSSIDSFGLDKIMEIINKKQVQDNLKILLVSHRKEIENFVPNYTYNIVKKNGFSFVEMI